jgi:hypothetical protein
MEKESIILICQIQDRSHLVSTLNFNKMKRKIILSFLLGSLALTGCKKYFGDINTNPNSPMVAEPAQLLPGIQATMSYAFGGDASRYSAILNQQIKGESRQWAVLQNYKFVGSDVESLFATNIYNKVLMEIQNLKTISSDKGYHHYNGIAKALEAYTLLFVADFWNAAPYSEAFGGLDKLQPKYDTQAELYASILVLLNEARADLGQANGGDKLPSNDDLIYAGDATKWIGFANFVEARMNLRLAKKDNSKYQVALDLLANGLVEDMAFQYSGGGFANPMYLFNRDWQDISIGDRISELMTEYVDPREALYAQPFDDQNSYFTDNRTHVMASLIEQEFMLAECHFNISGSSTAHANYLNGIALAFDRDGLTAAYNTYVTQSSVDPGAGSLTLELIMNQKYLALFLDYETFTDWRRTGFPTLTPNNGNAIPRKFPTPQSELNLNGANVPSSTIYSAVDWD